jgi:hypothetical protein
MATLFEKLNLKDQKEILLLNAPEGFEAQQKELRRIKVHNSLNALKQIDFALVFATKKSEVDALSKDLAVRAKGDAILWFAYPKGTSRKFNCNFNRDNGWDVLHSFGFDTVRAVAIDEDWSALRFRRKEFIKKQ